MSKNSCKSCGAALRKKDKKLSTCTYCGSSLVEPNKQSSKEYPKTPPGKKYLIMSIALAGLFAAVIAVFFLYETRDRPQKPEASHSDKKIIIEKNIAIDLVHGTAWQGMVEQLEQTGSKVVLIDTKIQPETLKPIDALIIHGTSGRAFEKNEIEAIVNFTKTGNTLIAADLAWSWTYKAYGNKPLEDFPLNRLGEKLGYQITGKNINEPRYLDKDLKSFVHKIDRTNWAPSKVKFFNDDFKALIRDNRYEIISGFTKSGKGSVFVCGHRAMLSENPRLLLYFLKY